MSKGPAAPESGTPDTDIPTFEQLAADPEIAALLGFEPAPVRRRINGWDADAQRASVAHLAMTGSKLHAAKAVGRNAGSLDRIFKRDNGAAFKAAVDGAMALAAKRHGKTLAKGIAAAQKAEPTVQAPGQVLNEFGEWEDEDSYLRRADEAKDDMAMKLLRVRRLFLQEISGSPGKRAAFEILTDYEVDWDKAARLEPQDDEPYRTTNQREPDMILTAESGWSFGEIGYGEDKKAELRRAIDEHRASEGLPAVDWDGADPHPCPSPASGRGRNAAERQEGEGL